MPDEGTNQVAEQGTGTSATNQTGASGQEGNNSAQGGNNLGWRAGLPSDLRDHEAFRDKGTVGDLAREHLSLRDKIARAVVIPGDSATPDEKKAFLQKLGVPESPDTYTINDSEDAEFTSHFKKLAHEAGLTPQQAEAVHNEVLRFSNSRAKAFVEQQNAEKAAEEAKLKEEWGPSYEQNDAAARRFLLVAGEDLADALSSTGLIEKPSVRRGLYRLSRMISEDTLVTGRGGAGSGSEGWRFTNTPGM